MKILSIITTQDSVKKMGLLIRYAVDTARLNIQKKITTTLTLVQVTVRLYFDFSNSTSNLSMLMVVTVNKDTPHKVVLTTYVVYLIRPQTCQCPLLISNMEMTKSGCETRPTQRSLAAKERNRILELADRVYSFLRENRIRMLPHDVAMERKMFTTAVTRYHAKSCFVSL